MVSGARRLRKDRKVSKELERDKRCVELSR
jgi:hypothetical protein